MRGAAPDADLHAWSKRDANGDADGSFTDADRAGHDGWGHADADDLSDNGTAAVGGHRRRLTW